jgi:predicted nuclease of predicted toxin-antitoxin system
MGDSVTLCFLIDEDVPRSTTRVLRDAGFDVLNVHEAGLQGKSDDKVFEYAQSENRLLITCDMGFSNILKFPPSENHGILVVRVPDSEPIDVFNREILNAVHQVGENLYHHLAIVEIGKVRLRG